MGNGTTVAFAAPSRAAVEAFHAGGDWVKEGQEAGRIYDFHDPLRPPTPVYYNDSGCLWAVHSGARVERFDVLAHVMNEIGRAELGI